MSDNVIKFNPKNSGGRPRTRAEAKELISDFHTENIFDSVDIITQELDPIMQRLGFGYAGGKKEMTDWFFIREAVLAFLFRKRGKVHWLHDTIDKVMTTDLSQIGKTDDAYIVRTEEAAEKPKRKKKPKAEPESPVT